MSSEPEHTTPPEEYEDLGDVQPLEDEPAADEPEPESEPAETRLDTTVLDEAQRRVESGDRPELNVTPALTNLHESQRAWLRRWRTEGFGSRRELLLALHQLQVWTLGRVPSGWFKQVATSDVLLTVAITDERERRRYRDNPVDLKAAESERDLLASKYIRPRVRRAWRDLRPAAQEVTNEEQRKRFEDPEKQPFPAMRPRLYQRYVDQADATVRLLDGFRSLEHVEVWLEDLDEAGLGLIEQLVPDLDWKIRRNDVIEDMLVHERHESKFVAERELWVAKYLLPTWNAAIRAIARDADEHGEDTREKGLSPRDKQL
ncbi:hypothetical protein [Halobaculum sp. EA56]|uniref:hypothetical protein n=1 Tax=Halobaculum sp. EA56 TaxID=3421648 RepID=UPI003EB94FCD